MMLKLYDNSNIDRQKWDSLLDSSEQGVIYAKSWYLDILFPEWKALIAEKDNIYFAGVPFCPKSRYGIRSIHHPYFSQQLGIFSRIKSEEKELLNETIQYWTKNFHYADYFFNSSNSSTILSSVYAEHFRKRITYILDLSADFESLRKNFSKNILRNIKKASQNKITVASELDPEPLIDLFRKNKGADLPEITEYHYQNLKKLIAAAHKNEQAELLTARDEGGKIIGGAFFLHYKNKIIYLFGSGSEEAKKTGAFPCVFDQLIQQHADSKKILDFEGSEIPGLARFYAGFGALPTEFHAYHHNRIKWLVNLSKKFKIKKS